MNKYYSETLELRDRLRSLGVCGSRILKCVLGRIGGAYEWEPIQRKVQCVVLGKLGGEPENFMAGWIRYQCTENVRKALLWHQQQETNFVLSPLLYSKFTRRMYHDNTVSGCTVSCTTSFLIRYSDATINTQVMCCQKTVHTLILFYIMNNKCTIISQNITHVNKCTIFIFVPCINDD